MKHCSLYVSAGLTVIGATPTSQTVNAPPGDGKGALLSISGGYSVFQCKDAQVFQIILAAAPSQAHQVELHFLVGHRIPRNFDSDPLSIIKKYSTGRNPTTGTGTVHALG